MDKTAGTFKCGCCTQVLWTLSNDGIPDVVPRNIKWKTPVSPSPALRFQRRNKTLRAPIFLAWKQRGSFSPLQSFHIPFDAGSLASRKGTGHAQGQEHEGLKTQDKRLKAEGEGNNNQQVQRCNAAVLAAALFTKKEHTNAAAAHVDTSRDDKQVQRLKAADRAAAVITTEVPTIAAAACSLLTVTTQTKIGDH